MFAFAAINGPFHAGNVTWWETYFVELKKSLALKKSTSCILLFLSQLNNSTIQRNLWSFIFLLFQIFRVSNTVISGHVQIVSPLAKEDDMVEDLLFSNFKSSSLWRRVHHAYYCSQNNWIIEKYKENSSFLNSSCQRYCYIWSCANILVFRNEFPQICCNVYLLNQVPQIELNWAQNLPNTDMPHFKMK